MQFRTDLLQRFDGHPGCIICHDGAEFSGPIQVDSDSTGVNVNPGTGYDTQVDGEGFALAFIELSADIGVTIPDGAPTVTLKLGDKMTISGLLLEQDDGALLLAGDITYSFNKGEEAPETEAYDAGTYAVVVDRSKVTEGLPTDEDDDAGTAPAGDAPAGDAPAGDAPAGDAPAGDAPTEPGDTTQGPPKEEQPPTGAAVNPD